MRIGNISQGKIKCDNCKRTIIYSERYLIVNEKDGVESDEEGGILKHFCVECALEKGYGEYREEKKNKILTFFRHAELTPPKTEPDAVVESVAEVEAEPEQKE